MKSRSYIFTAVAVLCFVATLGFVTTVATPVCAAEYVFDVVPSDSLGIVIINRLSSTESKISKLCDNLQYPVPEPLKKIAEMVQGESGIDSDGTAALVAMPGEGQFAVENGIIMIPVADFDKFLSQFNSDNPGDKIIKAECKKTQTRVLIARKGGYALITSTRGEDAITAVLDSTKSVAASVEPWRGWLGHCDTAAIITGNGLTQFYNQGIAQLEEAKSVISQGGKKMKPFETVLDATIKQLGSGEKEIRAAAVGAVLQDGGGVELYNNVLFEPYGEMSEFFAKVAPNRDNPMAGLPKGPFVIAVSGAIPQELANIFGDFASDMLEASPTSYGLDQKQADSLADATEEILKEVRGFSMMLGIPAAGEPISTATHSVLWVEDSQKFLADYGEEIKEAIGKADKDKSLAKMSVRDVQIGNVKALEITVDLSAIISKDESDNQSQAIKAFYGPTGIMTAHVAAVDANTVVFSYDGQKALTAAIAAVKDVNDSLAGDKGVMAINRNLLPGGQWVGYWSPSGTVDFINSTPGRFGLGEGPKGQLPPFPTTTPIGITVKANVAGIVKAFYIPDDVVKAAGSYQSMFRDALARASQSNDSKSAMDSSDRGPAIIVEEETYETDY